MSDFALRFGLALFVVSVACAAIIISRRNYAKSADSERSIGAFRLEFQRSIDAAQAATIKTIRDNIFSVIKTINSTVRDLNVRLARLEERADETATHISKMSVICEDRTMGSAGGHPMEFASPVQPSPRKSQDALRQENDHGDEDEAERNEIRELVAEKARQ